MDTLQQKVRNARVLREAGETVQIPIPGYQGMLVGVYALMDWQTRVGIKLAAEEKKQQADPAETLWEIAADYLLKSSKTVEAVDGDERQDLQMPLGPELASWLGENEPASDGTPLAATAMDALPLIIPDGEDLIDHFEQMLRAQQNAAEGVRDQIAGESGAAS